MACGALFQCGSGFLAIDAPYLGLPGVDQDPHGCCDQRPAGERQPSVFSLSDATQGPGQLPGVLGEVATAVADLRQRFRLGIPGILDGPAIVNPANRNVVFQLAVPSTGPFAPRALLTYNSMARCQVMNPYGAKWRLLFEQQVIERGEDDAVVIKGDGSCWRYTDRDAESQFYLAPDGACNSLERTDDGWLETQPDGLELHYEELEDDQQQPSGVGRLATLARHDQVWTLTYDEESLLESMTDPYNRLTTFTYSEGHLSKITDHAGRETGFQIDGCCLRRVTLPESTVTSFVYDARGRVLAHVAPGGSRTSYSYDCCGRVETITTPLGEVTTFTQADGLHTRITDARGHITTLAFDEEDCHLASVTDPLDHVTTYTWHGNRVSGVVDANEHDTHLSFTTLSNRTQGVSAIVYGNSDTYTITYDANDRAQAVNNPRSYAATLTWDGYDRTVLRDATDQRITFTYNDAGQLETQQNEEGHTTTLVYDAVGNVQAHVNACGQRTSYTYNVHQQRQTVQNPEGHVFTTTYDDLNRPTAHVTPLDDQTLFSYAPNTLPEATCDPEGHITTSLYDANHRVEATIDALGQRTSYAYDEVGTATTKFIYDGNRLLEETDGADELQRQYTSTLDQWGELLSEYDGSETHDHLCDALGSTDALLDESQTATDRYQYRAFGVQTQQGSHATPFTFVGAQNYYRDSELELYYARARYYDPAAGRWLSEDPVGFAAGDVNLYRYVRNNPVNKIDPSGEGDLIEWLLGKPLADWLSGKDAPGARTRLLLELKQPPPEQDTAGSRRGRALEQAWSDYNKGYELAQRLDAAVGQMLEAVEQADRLMLDLGSSFTPIVSDLRDLQELITGTDLINHQKLDLLDRSLVAVAAILPLVAGRHIRIVRRTLGNFAAWLSEALRRKRFPERAGDRLLKVKSLIRNTEQFVRPDRVTEGVREVGAAVDVERAAVRTAQEGVAPLTIRSPNDLPFTSPEVDLPLDLGNLSLERVTAFENVLASSRALGSRGIRNAIELTDTQKAALRQNAGQLGLKGNDIDFVIGPSRYSGELADQIWIGPDVLPAPHSQRIGGTVFERLTPRAVIAHEAGHLRTTRAGTDFPGGSLLDEVQASLVGRQFPRLSKVERYQLLRDAVERARREGKRVRDLLPVLERAAQ